MRVVRVVPDVAGITKEFDYLVPHTMTADVRVGTSVRVLLGHRRVTGWVVADGEVPPPDVELRPLLAVRGWGPPPSVVELCRWAAWRWAGALCRMLGTASPPTLVRSLPPRRPPRPTAAAAPGAVAPSGAAAEVAGDALAGGVAVVRLAPAHDFFPLVEAATARLDGGGGGVLVLAPARQQAEALAARLRRLGAAVALVPEQWALARTGSVVAVGTRAACFAPLPLLSAAVVLDAHDQAYQEERAPTYRAWEVVVERAGRDGAPCALVSSCPTLELSAAGRMVLGSRRQERNGWPAVEVVDRRADDPRTGLYSAALVSLVRWAAAAPGRRVVCVLNRTGRVRLLACAACGELARCQRCGSAMGVGTGTSLVCRRCRAERPLVCERCGSTRLRALRVGVSTVREELEALAGTPVAEVTAGAAEAFEPAGPPPPDPLAAAVVVGTEAALHRVRSADAVAFLDLDAELLAPRLAAAEQALALVARAARLVGGPGVGTDNGARAAGADLSSERAPGRLLLQTRQPDHPVVRAAVSADPGIVSAAEAPVRSELGLPPACALALVSGAAADAYGSALAEAAAPGIEVRGPAEGVWSVRAPDHGALADFLAAVARPPGRLRVEVDPVRA